MRRPSNQRRGAVIVFVVVCLGVLLGCAALTIDVGYLFNVRVELQNAADSAALAGASALPLGPAAVRARARGLAAKQAGFAKLDVKDEDVRLGTWDKLAAKFTELTGANEVNANAVRVIARMSKARGNPVALFFAPAMGIKTADVSASATATFGTGLAWNVVIVQDITGSFKNQLPMARLADQAFLNCIRDHTSGQSEVGVAVFTGFGQVRAPLQTVDTGYASLSTTISHIGSCGTAGMPSCSGTNIGAGLDSAIGLLSGLNSKLPPAIIVVSDGQPQSSSGNPGYTDQALKNWAINSANTANAAGISVFTLFYSGNDNSAGAAQFLASLVRGKGTAHNTPNPADMSTELGEMCQEGLSLMLVE